MDFGNDILLIGLSGGPDSVVLLHHLHQLLPSSQLLVTHCNFHLRGDESMRDQHFCEEFCLSLNLPLLVKDFDTRSYMTKHHLSLELAARQLRYQWWEELASSTEANTGRRVRIAVGHHRDDSIETLLMNLMRGTGIKGLTGIPQENGRIIRPLSDLSRADILRYLDEHHLSYVTDSTNLENEATRNQIRNLLLPLMEQINPNTRDGIVQTMLHLQQTLALAEAQLDTLFASTQHYAEAGVEWDEFQVPASITDEAMIDTLFHHWSERHPHATRLRRIFYTSVDATRIASTCKLQLEDTHLRKAPETSTPCNIFDRDTLQFPLCVRHWQKGDRIQPLGMTGSRLVSDLFTDAHLSPLHKATTWIVADASGRILWVVGLRMADWCKITERTTSPLLLSFNP